ncbi:MAG: DNA polymerase III subunit beta [Nannocystaceae bacterium]
MEFEIDQASFQAALMLASTVADHRSTMPVLGNVLLTAESAAETQEHGRVICRATDMMLFVTERFPADVHKSGSISLAVRHLHHLIKTLPPGTVSVSSLDNHWAQIKTARSEFRLMGMAEHDFPEFPEPTDINFTEVSSRALAQLIQRTVFSVSTDEARLNLNGALFESDGSMATMVSTDGHRLTKLTLPLAGPDLAERGGVVIPRRGLIELRRVLERVGADVQLGIGAEHLFLRTSTVHLAVKLISIAFPPYRQVIPKSRQRFVDLGRKELLSMLRQAQVLAPGITATIRLELQPGTLKLSADNPELGVGNQELDVDYDGEGLAAGFNASYLIDGLEAIDADQVRLEFQGELDPCVIRPIDGPDYLAVVMPMRI